MREEAASYGWFLEREDHQLREREIEYCRERLDDKGRGREGMTVAWFARESIKLVLAWRWCWSRRSCWLWLKVKMEREGCWSCGGRMVIGFSYEGVATGDEEEKKD